MTAAVRTYARSTVDREVIVITWEGLDGDDTGTPVSVAGYTDKSVQIGAGGGATHGGATTVLQGSNDTRADPNHADHANAKWFTLVDPNGNAISATADKMEQVLENPLWIRPSQTGGSAGDLDIVLVCKRSRF